MARRLLSLTGYADIRANCLVSIDASRVLAFSWAKDVKTKSQSTADTGRDEFVRMSPEPALLCASTFDIDRQYLATVLEPKATPSLLLQSSIIIQESDSALSLSTSDAADGFPIGAENDTEGPVSAINEVWSALRKIHGEVDTVASEHRRVRQDAGQLEQAVNGQTRQLHEICNTMYAVVCALIELAQADASYHKSWPRHEAF
ncbi:hypothetical protein LTR53_000002 [Teratosphaeriaceae sp. CCFEE 6253]|nr:hypothetical protein LTR53_000002 [Teratosphaeriaceae sp. CCFEE 6253]